VEFINGYITSIAKLKDELSVYLSHTFFFEELPKGDKTIDEVVKKRITKLMDSFYEMNPTWTYDKELYANQFQNEMVFQKQDNWKLSLKTNTQTWLSLDSQGIKVPCPAKDCLIDNFIELIEDFLKDRTFKMFLMKGDILNDLSHHWGGIGFQDFFFETTDSVYLLHFEYCD